MAPKVKNKSGDKISKLTLIKRVKKPCKHIWGPFKIDSDDWVGYRICQKCRKCKLGTS